MKKSDDIIRFPIKVIHGDFKPGRKHELWILPDGDLLLKLKRDNDLDEYVALSKITRLVQTSGRRLNSWLSRSLLLTPSVSLVGMSWGLVELLQDPLPRYARKQVRFLIELDDGRYLCGKAPRYVFELLDTQLERLVDAQSV